MEAFTECLALRFREYANGQNTHIITAFDPNISIFEAFLLSYIDPVNAVHTYHMLDANQHLCKNVVHRQKTLTTEEDLNIPIFQKGLTRNAFIKLSLTSSLLWIKPVFLCSSVNFVPVLSAC